MRKGIRFRLIGSGEGVNYVALREVEGAERPFRLSLLDRHDKSREVRDFTTAEEAVGALVLTVWGMAHARYETHVRFTAGLKSLGDTPMRSPGFRPITASKLLARANAEWKNHVAGWDEFYYTSFEGMFADGWPKVPVPELPWKLKDQKGGNHGEGEALEAGQDRRQEAEEVGPQEAVLTAPAPLSKEGLP